MLKAYCAKFHLRFVLFCSLNFHFGFAPFSFQLLSHNSTMSVFGEAALYVFLDRLVGKSLDSALNFVADHGQLHQQLKQWESLLPDIQAVLDDAEEKQIKNMGVKKWLDDLQDLAYDVDDILDEFAYEELRLKVQKTQAQTSTSKVRKLIPTCFSGTSFTLTSFGFKNSMIPKVKDITARLNNLTTRRSNLGLSEILSQAPTAKGKQPRLQPTSVLDGAMEYVGRHKEKQELIELLKGNNSNGVSVLSIVGMGGMGKTTLAQLVYNDAAINESFDHKAWVCVSDNFDAVNITRTILKSIDPDFRDENDLNLLQVKLKEKLSGKRFLLVLDDIWNENYNDWTILRSPFGAGANIIVTTRLQIVSSIVDPLKTFYLDKLSDDDCLSIFTQHALKARNFDGHLHFKEIGEKMVKRCNGLPLAAKAIGSLLRTIKYHREWERIYESEIWNLPEEQCGIIPALRLSYHHLPSYLKRCFAYCSMLPKGYEFGEEEIVLLWRAEGLLQQKAMPQNKDLGNQYFQDLVSRSFFLISSKDKSRFIMHDLINDLAQVVAGEIFSKLEGDRQQKFSIRTRHASYIGSMFDTVKKFEAFDQTISLRAFLPLIFTSYYLEFYLTNVVLVDLLPRLDYLRVLSLSGYNIVELPDVFENLKHLRYLNFSYTKIKCLPDSLCTLYHLETLLLKKCVKLQKLPSKIEKLASLQYLDIRGANLIERMPFGIGKLTNLQRLSDFVIGEGDGHHIRELKYLSNLKGDFHLSGLENVNCQDAGEAKLHEKQGIDRLVVHWSEKFEKASRNKEVEERVLDSLRPPKKLEQLVIENYGGAKFSTWIADSSFKNMLSLELLNCKSCKSLPSIGRLSLLKNLSIGGLDEVHKIGVELFGANQSNAFASLETLCFQSMPNWEEWDPCEGDEQASKFPSLHELSIRQCPQLLGTLPTLLQSLQKLEIRECRKLVVVTSSFSSLHELSVRGCKELVDEGSSSAKEVTSLKSVSLSYISKFNISAERIMWRFASSEYFNIYGWKELESLSQIGLGLVGHRFFTIEDCPQLISLETEDERLQLDKILGVESLAIRDCERLNQLPEVLHAFAFLTRMRLQKCPSLVCFAKSNIPRALKKLEILWCENLQYLVDEKEDNNKNTSSNTCLLEHLEIQCCPSLKCLSSRGDICNQLQHLRIASCSNLSSLFLNAKLPVKLKLLDIRGCPLLECIAQDFNDTIDLERIYISDALNIKSLPRGLDKLIHLQEIELAGCSSLVWFEESGFPATNLLVFSIFKCENFGALPKCIHNFTSLQKLEVWKCSADMSFPEEGFPVNLTSLEISNGPKMYASLVEWGLNRLTSLQELNIGGEGCSHVVSFPEEGIGRMLPPPLTSICIENFENLEFMCSKGFQHLTSLHELEISNCPKLTSLPEKDMLLSLEQLHIFNCPLLEEGCSRGKGREWSKIAHIPYVRFQYKTVIPRELD
ncbi:putative disease resistance RPP13-like protein 1 [Gossypium arboreum]|uniref:putative disease resistance RPP13-like protein 1 n=1 Tax=Gossypium arboreum TaxID=29729 RepID=UPI00081976F7|nr:putative disease resistance RPP13-like protein 1 [Gossypium arboreum]